MKLESLISQLLLELKKQMNDFLFTLSMQDPLIYILKLANMDGMLETAVSRICCKLKVEFLRIVYNLALMMRDFFLNDFLRFVILKNFRHTAKEPTDLIKI